MDDYLIFQRILRASRFRVTHARAAVYMTLHRSPEKAASRNELVRQVQDAETGLSRPAILQAALDLQRAGLVRRDEAQYGDAIYRLRRG